MKIIAGFIGVLVLLIILGLVYVIGSLAITAYNDPRSIGEQIGSAAGDVVNGFENSTNSQ